MSGYIGASPVPQATQHREAFTATASQTSFPTAGYTPQFVDVYLNGVKLAAADYTATNGSDIVLTTGAALNDILEYVAYTPFEVASQTFTGTTTVDVLDVTGAATGTDLTLSGGLYVGGTGAANYLDDYEEGTFTFTSDVGTCNSARAVYTKVGDLVTIIANVNTFSNTGVASNVILVGLPFAVSGDGVGSFFAKGMTQTTEHAVYAAGTNVTFYGTYSGSAYDPLKYTDMTANSEFYLSVTYKTTA